MTYVLEAAFNSLHILCLRGSYYLAPNLLIPINIIKIYFTMRVTLLLLLLND